MCLLLCFQLHAERPVELFPLRLDARGVHRALEGHADGIGERRARDDELVSVGRQVEVGRAAYAVERPEGHDKAISHSFYNGSRHDSQFAGWSRR